MPSATNPPEGHLWPADRGNAPLQTLARGLRILRFVGQSRELVRLRDVAQAFGLERSVTLRLLQSLEAEGFVRKHEALKAYSLGPALEELARPRSMAERLTERAKPFLAQLAGLTGQTSHLGILENDRAVLVEVRMAAGPIAVQQSPGDHESLYCSAIGKSLYALLPEQERRRLTDEISFRRHKPATLGSVAALEEEAVQIRRDLVAFDRDEGPTPLVCIAAPILDERNYPVASVGISSIAALVEGSIDQRTDWIAAVRSCADRMAADLLR